MDFTKKKKVGDKKLKCYGILSCKKCANKWKLKLMTKKKPVRVIQTKEGWELWST